MTPAVIATEADAPVAAAITAWLDDPSAAVIVILSRAAARDPRWVAAVEAASGQRLIPVQVGDVRAEELPAIVGSLNWIPFRPDDEAQTKTDLLFALNADPRLYAKHRELAAEAQAWAASGRGPDGLIGNIRRAKEASEHIKLAERDALSAPTPLIRAYVEASLARSRKRRRRGRISRGWGIAFALFALAAAAAAVLTVRGTTRQTNLAAVNAGSARAFNLTRPDRVAMLSATLLLQGTTAEGSVSRSLRSMLAVPWAEGVIGQGHDQQILDSAIVEDGRAVLTLDSAGRLGRWDRRSTRLVSLRQLPSPPGVYVMSATPDGRTVAALLGQRLVVLRGGRRATTELPGAASDVAVSRDGRVIVVVTGNGLWIAEGSAAPRVRAYQDVLAVAPTERGVSALVRSGESVLLLDAATGRTHARTTLPEYRYETAAIGPGGQAVAITNADRQILYAPSKLAFGPTGQPVPDIVDALAVLPGGRVVHASGAFGVQLLDAARGVDLGPICAALPTAITIRSTVAGDLLACANAVVVLQRTTDLSAVETHVPELRAVNRAETDDVTVVGRPDGALDVTLRLGGVERHRFPVAEAAITTVALENGGRTVLAGAADGTVVELDLEARDASPVVVRWSAPDRAAVRAVGWAGDRLIAETVTGDRWSAPACDLCADGDELVDAVAERLWPCYLAPALEWIEGPVRERLGLRVCEAAKAR